MMKVSTNNKNYNIIEIQYKSETNLSESHTGWLGYLNHTRTVCTSMQMVTSPSNNKNGRNTIASNLLAPISFYLKMNSSLGLNDEKTSECDHNVMVHKVCYDPTNVGSQMYKIYLNPFELVLWNSGLSSLPSSN